MTRLPDDLDAALRDLPAPAPPGMGAALEAALGDLRPVRTRRPLLDFAKVAAVSAVYGLALIGLLTMRRDLHGLPTWWVVGYGGAWLVGFVALAYLAIVPRAGAVIPRRRLAGLIGVLVGLGFVSVGLYMDPGTAASRRLTLATIHHGHACLELGLATALVPMVLGALVLRGAVPVGCRWTAAGLGAAGGSLGGLVLHLHCAIADGWHLGLVHGGVVLLSAALAAALVPPIAERPFQDS